MTAFFAFHTCPPVIPLVKQACLKAIKSKANVQFNKQRKIVKNGKNIPFPYLAGKDSHATLKLRTI